MLNFTPPPTCDTFMQDEALVRFIIGPLGSGKSTACIFELLRRACEQEPDSRGIRPTRFAIVRNTTPQLKQTCLADIQQLLGPICDYKGYLGTIFFNIDMPDGTRVESEWLLLPLDSKEDTRRLLSLQLTGAWIEEFRETDYAIVSSVIGRIGRYPSKARIPPTWQGLIGSSNPFPLGSDWHEHLVVDKPKDWMFFQQPGGLDPDAENVENLPDGYYDRLMEGHSPDWIDVHVHGRFGPDSSGKAVFYSSFDFEYHTAPRLQVNPQSVLMVSFDFGRTPCCLFGQEGTDGKLVILDECISEDMGITQFVREKLKPKLADERYAKLRIVCTGDPSGLHKTQVDEISPVDVIEGAGLRFIPASTNDIDPRIRAVESLLLENRRGDAALIIDRGRCPTLVRAMASEYKFKKMKTGRVDDKPDKTHPWSDVADALQYMCLGMNSGLNMRANRQFFIKRAERAPITVGGWT